MTDLIVHLETLLEDSNDHIRDEAYPMLDGSGFGPSWRPRMLIEKALVKHCAKNLIVEFGPVVMENLRGSDAPSPNLIFRGAICQNILIPSNTSLNRGAHLDPPFQHSIDDLSNTSTSEDILYQIIVTTYPLTSGILALTIEGLMERTIVDLGDGPDGMIQRVGGFRVIAGNPGVKTSRNTVAQVGGKHGLKDKVGIAGIGEGTLVSSDSS